MSRRGFFTLDAVVAAGILVVIILVASSVMYSGYIIEQRNMSIFMDLQLVENHLDSLMSLSWDELGVSEGIGEGIYCDYVVSETEHRTVQLLVKFNIHGCEHSFVLEKRVDCE